jgi:hypothetical protein
MHSVGMRVSGLASRKTRRVARQALSKVSTNDAACSGAGSRGTLGVLAFTRPI